MSEKQPRCMETYEHDQQKENEIAKSKSIVHTDYNFNLEVRQTAFEDKSFYRGKRSLVCVPTWVIYGLVNTVYTNLVLGMELIFTLNYSEDVICRYLGQYDFVFGMPVCYRYLYETMMRLQNASCQKQRLAYEEIKRKLQSVSMFISGGDKMKEEGRSWQEAFGVPLINSCGNNELVGAAIVSPLQCNRMDTVGIPMYGTVVKAFDSDTDNYSPTGKLEKSSSLRKHYLRNTIQAKRRKTRFFAA